MAEIREIPLSEAKLHPANFLYVYATNSFLEVVDEKHRNIIRTKGLNQKRLMILSSGSISEKDERYINYKNAVADAFEDMYGMTPFDALLELARGGTVAGKNWEKNMYGVGAITSVLHEYSDNKGIKVTSDGHFTKKGVLIPDDQTRVEYADVNNKGIVYKRYYTDPDTNTTYALIYHKSDKKYYADSYSLSNGNVYSPAGIHLSGADGSTMWGNVILNWINAILNWFLSLFGVTQEKETLTAENTLPSQVEDGFAGVEPLISGSTVLLLAAAGGMLMFGGTKKKGSKRKAAAE